MINDEYQTLLEMQKDGIVKNVKLNKDGTTSCDMTKRGMEMLARECSDLLHENGIELTPDGEETIYQLSKGNNTDRSGVLVGIMNSLIQGKLKSG